MGFINRLGSLIGIFLKFLWKISPFVIRAIWGTLKVIGLTLLALFRGFDPTARDVANYWLDQAVANGFIRYDRELYYVLYVVAIATIVAGWIVCAYITVWLIGAIF